MRGLSCDATEASVLPISWTPPSLNAEAVNDYLVEVREYVQPQGSRSLQLVDLSPPFRRVVKGLGVEITEGVGK